MSNFRPAPKVLKKKTKKDRGNPQKARDEVVALDGECCILCGDTHGLQLHRIIYGSQMGKYEASNCVLLCVKHHMEIHTDKNKWMPYLQNLVSERGV